MIKIIFIFRANLIVVMEACETSFSIFRGNTRTALFCVAGTAVMSRFLVHAALDERLAVVENTNAATVCFNFFNLIGDVVAGINFLLNDNVIVLLKKMAFFFVVRKFEACQTSGKLRKISFYLTN